MYINIDYIYREVLNLLWKSTLMKRNCVLTIDKGERGYGISDSIAVGGSNVPKKFVAICLQRKGRRHPEVALVR